MIKKCVPKFDVQAVIAEEDVLNEIEFFHVSQPIFDMLTLLYMIFLKFHN
jgi:hypothetical protein